MYKYYDALLNRSGDALAGYYVRLFDAAGNPVDIYADENLTPIITESGVANAAKSDDDGMVRFYVESGEYDLKLYDASDTFVTSERAIPMVRGVNEVDLSGDTGAALVGSSTGDTVQQALDARPTSTVLASPAGGAMVGNELPAGSNLQTQAYSTFVASGVLQPSQFAGTASQQLTRAITEAGTVRNDALGQTVQLPRGEIPVSATFNIDNRATISGVNKRGSRIVAQPGHTGPYMATVKNGTSSMFDNALCNLTLDANDVAGLGCIDSEAWQEGGGLQNVLLQKFTGIGVSFTQMYGGASLTAINGCEIFGSEDDCICGIKLDDGLLSQTFQLSISNTSIVGGGALASSMPRAIDVVKGTTRIYNSHVENCTTGLYLDGAGDHVLIGFTGSNSTGGVENLVEVAATFVGGLRMIGCRRNGATNFIKDNRPNGYGTISGYDPAELVINPEPAVALGAVVAAGKFDGFETPPTTATCFGVDEFIRNGDGDWYVIVSRTGSANSWTGWVSANVPGGCLTQIDNAGASGLRIRLYDSAGDPVNASEVHFGVARTQ